MESLHVVIFPFMSKGHAIPMLNLARLLCRRRISVTVFTTPSYRPFIDQSLSDTPAAVIDLPFPENASGVESTDGHFSLPLYVAFACATASMQPGFERALRDLGDVSLVVADGFLWWAQESADRVGVPRAVFFGMSGYAMAVTRSVGAHGTVCDAATESEVFAVPDFPWVGVTRGDIHAPFNTRDPEGPHFELVMKQMGAAAKSLGIVFNSFYELEPVFADQWNRRCQPRGWWVGPLCLAQSPRTQIEERPWWAKWLDDHNSVLYVAFGSQVKISPEQLKEIAIGLERSEVSFMWVTRTETSELPKGYEERVKDRGVIVREWVDQAQILAHARVRGFLSHCGWNSVMESACAGVPILAWPMMAEQPLNAKMVVEELKVGLRVGTGNETVKAVDLEEAVRELMEEEKGKSAREAVRKYAAEAKNAMEEGGSSARALDAMIGEIITIKN